MFSLIDGSKKWLFIALLMRVRQMTYFSLIVVPHFLITHTFWWFARQILGQLIGSRVITYLFKKMGGKTMILKTCFAIILSISSMSHMFP